MTAMAEPRAAAVESAALQIGDQTLQLPIVEATDGSPAVDVAALLKLPLERTVKAIALVREALAYGEPGHFALVLLRGDRELSELKLRKALGAGFHLATAEEVVAAHGTEPGYIGPVPTELPVYADEELRRGYYVAGANEADRQLLLRHPVHRRDQALELWISEDLQLVQQEEHPRVGLCGKRPNLCEELTEVLLELAAVSKASLRLPLKAQAHLALGADRRRERSQRPACTAQRATDRASPFVGSEGGPHEPGDDDPEVAPATPLVAKRLPSRGLGARCELGEEHRLADPAQPVDDQALLAATARETPEQIREPLGLTLAPHQGGRQRAGARRVRVLKRIHLRESSDI